MMRSFIITARTLAPAMRPALSVAGFAFLTAAAWVLHVAAGLAVAGVSCLLIEALTGDEPGRR